MKNFINNWNNDPKFKVKIKLTLYSLFVLIVSIYAIVSSRYNNITNTYYQDDAKLNNQLESEENEIKENDFKIPEKYNYIINISINDTIYLYEGTITQTRETIKKNSSNIETKYIYQNEKYYKAGTESYLLTTKEEVYDIIDKSFLKLETIEKYLKISTKKEEINIVYLKDIILGNESEEYISIKLNDNIIKIDYTALMNLFDDSVKKCIVEITINEIE